VTGLAAQFDDLVTKQLQILKEMFPRIARVAILHYVGAQPNPNIREAVEAAARPLGLKERVIEIRDVPHLEGAFRTAKAEQANAMHVSPSAMFSRHRARLAELAVKHHLPGIYESKEYVDAGGLMSYGPSFPDMFRRSASYVDRILKGAKPADLPIEQPTKFELVINAKTAKGSASRSHRPCCYGRIRSSINDHSAVIHRRCRRQRARRGARRRAAAGTM
jgi:ABC-type uncharacterized transport system substrate-binding protein